MVMPVRFVADSRLGGAAMEGTSPPAPPLCSRAAPHLAVLIAAARGSLAGAEREARGQRARREGSQSRRSDGGVSDRRSTDPRRSPQRSQRSQGSNRGEARGGDFSSLLVSVCSVFSVVNHSVLPSPSGRGVGGGGCTLACAPVVAGTADGLAVGADGDEDREGLHQHGERNEEPP